MNLLITIFVLTLNVSMLKSSTSYDRRVNYYDANFYEDLTSNYFKSKDDEVKVIDNKSTDVVVGDGKLIDKLKMKVTKRQANDEYSIDEDEDDDEDDDYVIYTTYPNGTTYTNLTEEQFKATIIKFIAPKTGMFVLIVISALVFIIGLIGNVLVCVAVYKNHTMRTVTNYFIVNLAVADFLVILFCLPPTVIWDVTLTWFFGVTMCKIVLYLQVSQLLFIFV